MILSYKKKINPTIPGTFACTIDFPIFIRSESRRFYKYILGSFPTSSEQPIDEDSHKFLSLETVGKKSTYIISQRRKSPAKLFSNCDYIYIRAQRPLRAEKKHAKSPSKIRPQPHAIYITYYHVVSLLRAIIRSYI